MSENIISSFSKLVDQHPEKKLFTYLQNNGSEKTVNYGQIDYKARQIATLLKSIGSPGDRVLLMTPPVELDFIASFIGAAYAQMILVPVMPPVTADTANKLKLIIENSQPIACLTTQEIYERISKLKLMNQLGRNRFLNALINRVSHQSLDKFNPLIEANIFSLSWIITDNLANTKPGMYFDPPAVDPESPLFLQYTSGSTGNPKGVIVTHKSILHNIEAIKYCLQIQDQDILYSWLPPYHDMGLIGCLLTPIYTGLYTIIDSPFSFLTAPVSWLQGMSKYRCTISAAPNFAYELCANKVTEDEKKQLDLSSWRVAVNSAEPIRATTLQRFYEKFRDCGFKKESFYPSYGLAEATLFVTTKSLQPHFVSIAVDKYALQEGKVKLVEACDQNSKIFISSGDIDDNIKNHRVVIANPDTCCPVSEGQIGEVWVSSLSVNPGYWGQEAQELFQARLASEEGVYLKTGDLGFIQSGQLYITGRIKDLIIIRGRNYYPQDLEHTVEQAHEAIRAGCVNAFSIDHEDQEQLVLLVEVKQQENYNEIAEVILEQMIRHHGISPTNIAFLAPKVLKKTTSGKVRRREMKKLYLTNELAILCSWNNHQEPAHPVPVTERSPLVSENQTQDSLSVFLMNTMRNTLRNPDKEILLSHTLTELGFDSLLTAEFISNLQLHLPESSKLSMQDFLNNPTVGEIIQLLQSQLKEEHILVGDCKINSIKTYSAAEQQYWMNIAHLPEYEHLHSARLMLGEQVANTLYFNVIEGISDNCIALQDKHYINFSGYNYLGYAGDERVIAATCDAVTRYGTSVSASRLISGQKPIHTELEHEIAALIGAEDAIVFTAGHATNTSVITHLFNAEDVIFHDALIHNSSLQGAIFSKAKRIPFPHNDVQALARLMEKERRYYRRALILIEGVYSMDGDIPDVPEFIKVKNQYNAQLMIDEAHSIGVIGADGGGIRSYFNLRADDVELWMGTLSKAFASCGGYVAGKKELIDYLKCSCGGFVFSAGMTPANAAAALTTIRLLKKEPFRPQQLRQRAAHLLSCLQEHHIDTGLSQNTPIIPIIVREEMNAVQLCLKLREQGIYTIPIIYPAVDKGLARIRLFMNYLHTEEQLAYTAEMISKNLL